MRSVPLRSNETFGMTLPSEVASRWRPGTGRQAMGDSIGADKMIVLRNGHQREESIMTTQSNPASPVPGEATASRREFVAAAVTMAAGTGALTGSVSGAQAQTPPSNLRFMNPPGMSNPPGYSHVVEVTGPHRVVYFAGQTGADANGKVAPHFRAPPLHSSETT